MRNINAYSLKSFYNSGKGQIVRNLVRLKILNTWPEITSQHLMGYGYALPYMRPYLGSTSQIFNMMPAQLGVHNWPPESKNCVCLHVENLLPLQTNSVDFVLMVHFHYSVGNPDYLKMNPGLPRYRPREHRGPHRPEAE